MKAYKMGRDNISGIKLGFLKTIFLFPGMIIQWCLYMSVGNVKGYSKVRQQTRLARSPFMTWMYSIMSWAGLVYFLMGGEFR
jgi:hypothetical protein